MAYLPWCLTIISLYCLAASGHKVKSSSSSQTSVSSSSSQGPTYSAKITLRSNGDECVETVVVKGNGVSDTLKLPCKKDKTGRSVVNVKENIVIGGDAGDNCGILGNKPNTLVVLGENSCVAWSYPPVGHPKKRVQSDKECAEARREARESQKKAKDNKETEEKQMNNFGNGLESDIFGFKDTTDMNMDDPFKMLNF